MELKTHTEENALVVVVTGKMDAITAPQYVERLKKELAGERSDWWWTAPGWST